MSEQYTEDQKVATVPFFIHEATVERLERLNKRWFIFALIVFIALIATNAGWIVYESQYETYYYSQEAQTDNAPAITLLNTGEGDINYGQGKTSSPGTSQEDQLPQPDETVPKV